MNSETGEAARAAALNYQAGGPAGAPTLLLIHPMGADLTFWDACRARWQERFRCVAVDLRGAGGSPSARRPVSISEHAADLAAFLDDTGAGPVVPIGCAVGAMVAAAFAGLCPARCAGLVLSNPGFRTLPSARDMLAKRADSVRREGMQAVLPGAVDNAFVGCPRDERRDAYARRFAALDPMRYALEIEGMLDADTSSFLPQISCPTLIIAGGKDGLLPPAHAREIHERVPSSHLVVLPDGAHFIPYQRPDEFARMVTGFLDRRPRAIP